jgi:osmotically-inducible protein OsmY
LEDKMTDDLIVKEVRVALERDPRTNLHHGGISIACENGVVTIQGEVDGIIGKKISLEAAAAVPGVTGIVDRLRVAPAEVMEDGAIRDHVCDALLEEPSFREYSLRAMVKGSWETCRSVDGRSGGELDVEIANGVVTLNGTAGSISHKRLAGVLAWWVPGTRDVINGLELGPPMPDNDYELADAVRLVLEKDPFVNASQIRVGCREYVVVLDGIVPNLKEREMAESDAWYVFQVNRVINRLQVVK